MGKKYNSHLFQCFLDIPSCIFGSFCFLCLNSSNLANILNEDLSLTHLFIFFHPFWVRKMIQEKNNIHSTYCDDCLVTTFCLCCAICQDSRELHWKYINE